MRTANHRPAFAGNDNGAPKGMKMRTGRSSFDRVQIKPSLLFRQWRALTGPCQQGVQCRSEEHTSELQSLMRISYAVFCLTKKHLTLKKQTRAITYNYTITIQRNGIE